MPSYKGECFCGAVQIREAGGERLLPLPILPFLVSRARQCLHALEARTAGAEHIATFPKTACSQRQYCKNCGGHLMTNHPRWSHRRLPGHAADAAILAQRPYQLC